MSWGSKLLIRAREEKKEKGKELAIHLCETMSTDSLPSRVIVENTLTSLTRSSHCVVAMCLWTKLF